MINGVISLSDAMSYDKIKLTSDITNRLNTNIVFFPDSRKTYVCLFIVLLSFLFYQLSLILTALLHADLMSLAISRNVSLSAHDDVACFE